MAATIKDVAKLAGVATSTVSRVLADSDRISKETKEKVMDAMEKLEFHRNYHAHTLASKQSNNIAIVLPQSDVSFYKHPFFPEVLRGINDCAIKKGYSLVFSNGIDNQQHSQNIVEMIKGRRVDGFIWLYSEQTDPMIDFIKTQNVPFVMVGKPSSDDGSISYVTNDNVLAVHEVTQYLIQMGHRKIAYLSGRLNFVVNQDRLMGFLLAMEEAKLPVDSANSVSRVIFGTRSERLNKLREIMLLPDAPSAVVAVDDVIAMSVMSLFHELGISVPEQCSIAGISNIMFSEISAPPLTTIDLYSYDVGYQATEKLLKWIGGGKPDLKPVIIKHHLVKRKSTAPPKNS
ncbi:DNA-binding LacI/PurR family transcriptional regulator [Fontibacillus solani]|uniref:DNA-binding transcriptional regulator, LacI/PurR family n=2 Tax=Fontibacillus TaxID=995014 RepID=A0A1G7RR14_9BACL|nr:MULTISPECIES: LacI family DNA-binding transcriptional regulator [Fontibacillus]MBA9088846.1 DNA-binding LacI/PurR family transcriptional regulator [Fontibacillus solani]SDG12649.1 DNA-binding transcriptional regulator, LacI/PurR family [Fontibacillus panacisegetis]